MTSAIQLLQELFSINSVNPDLVPGAAGETDVVKHRQLAKTNGLKPKSSRRRRGARLLSASSKAAAAGVRSCSMVISIP